MGTITQSLFFKNKDAVVKHSNQTSAVEEKKYTIAPFNNFNTKKNNVSFKGLPAVIEIPPIEKKISAVLKHLQPDELILVGETSEKASKLLKDSIGSVKKLITKLFFIEDKEVNHTFAVTKDGSGTNQFLNLTNKPVGVKGTDVNGEQKLFVARKGISLYLKPDDTLLCHSMQLHLNDHPSGDTPKISEVAKEFDFSNNDSFIVKGLNTKHVDLLTGPKENPVKKITFADVGGQNNVIQQLKKGIIYPIKYPEAFKNNIVNHGIVLTGGPGTGKSLVAEALANEANAHFIKISASELETKWVGDTEKKWRELFEDAKEKQPTVIVIDEADAVFKRREGSDASRHDDKTVNQVLALMSDLEKSKDNVFVVATTNKLELLDEAVIRSGRFGQHIEVKNPDLDGCKHILAIHSKNMPVSEKFNSEEFAKKMHKQNVSGADIAKIANDANGNAFDRAGIYEKMENETYQPSDTENLKIEQVDFDKALKSFEETKNKIAGAENKSKPWLGLIPTNPAKSVQERFPERFLNPKN